MVERRNPEDFAVEFKHSYLIKVLCVTATYNVFNFPA